jgi:hypothetical protein
MTDKPPPWTASEAMVRWMHRKLDERQAEMMRPTGNSAKHSAWLKADGPEIYYAEHGEIEPLRKKYPRLAPFLFALEPKNPAKATRDDAIATAVWAYKCIPEIWQKEYGRKNRRRGQVGALEIAARWMDVAKKDILTRMNKSGPSGKKKKL